MMTHAKTNLKTQKGAALFVGLMLLLVMTIVAVTAMRSTNLEVRMARNDNQKMNAFVTSEGPRPLSGDVLDDHIFDRGWDGVSTPDGLKITTATAVTMGANDDGSTFCLNNSGSWETENGSTCVADGLYDSAPIVLGDTNTLDKHMVYSFAGSDGTTRLTLNKVATKLATGTSAAMVSGYEGTGKAAAASGANIYFDIRSAGRFNEANVMTGTDYRIVIRN